MTYTPTHSSPVSTEELTYDPYAKIVINTHKPAYAGVTPEVLEAHQVTSLSNNERIRRDLVTKYENSIDKVRDYLIENLDELEEYAVEIARLLDIELSRTVEVEVNVTYNLTVELEAGKDVSDLNEWDFDLTISESNNDFEISDYSTDVIYVRES